jgi:hypothetical protein
VSELEEQSAIEHLLIRYCSAIDSKNWGQLESCFAVGATARYDKASFSSDRISADFERAHERVLHSVHRLSNVDVSLDGERAQARSYVDALLVGDTHLRVVGTYDDCLRRNEDSWQIEQRTFTTIWTEGDRGLLNPVGELSP